MKQQCTACWAAQVSFCGGRVPDDDDYDLPLCFKHTMGIGLIVAGIITALVSVPLLAVVIHVLTHSGFKIIR